MPFRELLDALAETWHRALEVLELIIAALVEVAQLLRIGTAQVWSDLIGALQSIPSGTWETITAIATAAAAFFAAFSAWTSRQSARAAQEAVEEARKAQKEEKAPRLVLEKDFLDFQIVGPHKETHHDQPFYEAREDHTTGYRQTRATFSLTNHGGGPALELRIVFDLDDPERRSLGA